VTAGLAPRTVPVERSWTLWDNAIPLLVVLLALGLDGILRRRHGLP
jgi:hypothetical protein